MNDAAPSRPGSGATIERIVRCPACGGRSVFGPRNPHRPFCCAACKGIDLGAWASDQYRIAAGPDGRDPDEPDTPDPQGSDTRSA